MNTPLNAAAIADALLAADRHALKAAVKAMHALADLDPRVRSLYPHESGRIARRAAERILDVAMTKEPRCET